MINIDDICRDIVRKRHPFSPYCPYGRRPSFDDLWEDDKNYLRETVKNVIDAIGQKL